MATNNMVRLQRSFSGAMTAAKAAVRGTYLMFSAIGGLEELDDTANCVFAGIALNQANGSGTGGLPLIVEYERVPFFYETAAAALTDNGQPVYALAAGTMGLTPSNVIVGNIIESVAGVGWWIDPVQITGLTQNLNTDAVKTYTATLTSAAAATPVELVPATDVGAAEKVYIVGLILKVNGATAWTDTTATIVTIADTAGSPVTQITAAKAQLTGNAVLGLFSTGITLAAGVSTGTGATTAKGLTIQGDAIFAAGSDIVVTVLVAIK